MQNITAKQNLIKANDRGYAKIIGFDLDGVIIDHGRSKIQLARERGINLRPEQTPADAIRNISPLPILREIRQLLYHDPEISLRSPLMRGVKSGLTKIKNRNLPYFLVSRRKDTGLAITLLKLRGLWPKYFNEQNTFFVDTPEDKEKKAKELGITHYIDDETNILEKLESCKKQIYL